MVCGWGCGGCVELTFMKTQKTAKKTQKRRRENTKNNLFFEYIKNNEISFYCSQISDF